MTKTISDEIVYEGKIGKIHKVILQAENGRTEEEEFIEKCDTVMIVAVDEEQQLFFIREYSPAAQKYELSFPRGKADHSDDLPAEANRELQEEAGMKADALHKLATLACYSKKMTTKTHVFLAQNLTESKIEGDEIAPLEVLRYSFEEAEDMIGSGEINEARAVAAFYLAKKYLYS